MDQIPPHQLWIGSAGDLRDLRPLHDAGIRAIVHLAHENLLPTMPHDLVVCRFPLVDGINDNDPDILRAAIVCLTQLLEQKFACLVCCHMGMNRSPLIAAAALSRLLHKSFEASLEEVARHRRTFIHAGVRAQVQVVCELL